MIQWRNPQQRKHKTWVGDGVAVIKGLRATLYGTDGKTMGSGTVQHPIEEGREFHISSKDIQLETEIPKSEYLSGSCFGRGVVLDAPAASSSLTAVKQFVPLTISSPAERPMKGIPLQPFDLLASSTSNKTNKPSTAVAAPEKVAESHWMANWCVD
jgi:DNA repair and recombination protein RAD54B